jgi:hypothetical protein
MTARMTPAVAALANSRQSSDDTLDVVLELAQPDASPEARGDRGPNRAERIAHQKASFEAAAEQVKAVVRQAGGSVEGEAWINCTIKARIPTRAIERLQEVEAIIVIDLPHRLDRE